MGDVSITAHNGMLQRRQVVEAFARHCRENHNADYEVCDDPQCKAAYAVEQRVYAECARADALLLWLENVQVPEWEREAQQTENENK